MSNAVAILLNGIFSFVYLFVLAKLLGKKQIAELNFADYTIGISLGSISAEWAIDTTTPWYNFAIAMAVFFALSLIITFLQRKNPFFKQILHGSPIVLISNGKFDYQNLKKSKLDINDVLGMCRAKGCFDTSQIAFAVLETGGELSVLPKAQYSPTVAKDFNFDKAQAKMENYLILDGRVYQKGLDHINKDKDWLYGRIGILNNDDLKKYLLVSYNKEKDSFNIQLKNETPKADETK